MIKQRWELAEALQLAIKEYRKPDTEISELQLKANRGSLTRLSRPAPTRRPNPTVRNCGQELDRQQQAKKPRGQLPSIRRRDRHATHPRCVAGGIHYLVVDALVESPPLALARPGERRGSGGRLIDINDRSWEPGER